VVATGVTATETNAIDAVLQRFYRVKGLGTEKGNQLEHMVVIVLSISGRRQRGTCFCCIG